MVYYENDGYLETTSKQASGEIQSLEVSTDQPSYTQVEVLLKQDRDGDGTADDTYGYYPAGGVQVLDPDFEPHAEADYWMRFNLSTDDIENTPTVHYAEVTFETASGTTYAVRFDAENENDFRTATTTVSAPEADSLASRTSTTYAQAHDAVSVVSPVSIAYSEPLDVMTSAKTAGVSTSYVDTVRAAHDGYTLPARGVLVDDLSADYLEGHFTPTRGEEFTLSLLVRTSDKHSETAPDRYESLREFLEYAGEADTGKLEGGDPYVRENPIDSWPVDSHVVALRFGRGVHHMSDMWAVVVGGTDNSEIRRETENRYRLDMDMVYLAPLDEYDSRGELLDDLSPGINQY